MDLRWQMSAVTDWLPKNALLETVIDPHRSLLVPCQGALSCCESSAQASFAWLLSCVCLARCQTYTRHGLQVLVARKSP